MNRIANFFSRKALVAPALALSLFLVAHTASAQTQVVFADNFDSDAPANSLSDQNGWFTNDEYTGGTFGSRFIGQSDVVQQFGAYAAGINDQQAYLGGALNFPGGAVPGQPTVYLAHNVGFGVPGTAQLDTDFVVTASGGPGTLSNRDTFRFTFRANGGIDLFSVNFTPTVANPTTSGLANISTTTGTGIGAITTPAALALTLGARYHLTVAVTLNPVTGGTYSVLISTENVDGTGVGAPTPIIAGVPFTGNIGDIAATWALTDVTPSAGVGGIAYANGGTNGLIIDNFVVSVPEPSTYAMMGIGLAGLVATMKVRRAHRA